MKMTDFERESSFVGFSLTFAFFLVLFLKVLPFFFSLKIEVSSPEEGRVAINLATFREEVVLATFEQEPIEQQVVELNETDEIFAVREESAEEVFEVFADEDIQQIRTDSTVQLASGEATQRDHFSSTIAAADKDIIVLQVVSLIEQKKEYSRRARQRGVEGIVVVEITLSEECVVSSFIIAESESSLLDNSVHETMNKIVGMDVSDERLHEILVISVPIEFILI